MSSYFEVILISVPSLKCDCHVTPSIAWTVTSQVDALFSHVTRLCHSFLSLYSAPGGDDFPLKHMGALHFLMMLKNTVELPSPFAFKIKLVFVGVVFGFLFTAVHASSSLVLISCESHFDLMAAKCTFHPRLGAWPHDFLRQ